MKYAYFLTAFCVDFYSRLKKADSRYKIRNDGD